MYEIRFPPSAHGFKLSPNYPDRLYYYPDGEYKMDMAKINPGRWVVERVVRHQHYCTVILKSV